MKSLKILNSVYRLSIICGSLQKFMHINISFQMLIFMLCFIADVDECLLGRSSSTCNAFSEHCVNGIGSYTCSCNEGFSNISGKCEGKDANEQTTA